MKLNPYEVCPIHGRRDCCGREPSQRRRLGKWEQVRAGVRRIRDKNADHPDGYRYKLSPAEMKKVVDKKLREQYGICAHCHCEFTDYSEVGPDHIKPKGMGGSRADDRPENIRVVHHKCNSEKGSRRIPEDETDAVQQNSPSDISGGIDDANCEGRGSEFSSGIADQSAGGHSVKG